MNGGEVDQTLAKAQRYDLIIETITTMIEVLVIAAIFLAGAVIGYWIGL